MRKPDTGKNVGCSKGLYFGARIALGSESLGDVKVSRNLTVNFKFGD